MQGPRPLLRHFILVRNPRPSMVYRPPSRPAHHVRRVSTPIRADARVHALYQPTKSFYRPTLTSDVSYQTLQAQPEPAGSGWTSVNPSHERGPSQRLHGRIEPAAQSSGELKHPELATLPPQIWHERNQGYNTATGSPTAYSAIDTNGSGSRYNPSPSAASAPHHPHSNSTMSTAFFQLRPDQLNQSARPRR